MRLHRFVVGPERLEMPYGDGFRGAVRMAAVQFRERHGEFPNACCVSLDFAGPMEPLRFEREQPSWEDAPVLVFYCQTLLEEGEALLGVEEIVDMWEGDDGQFDERCVG